MNSHKIDAAWCSKDGGWVERECLLFEAGDYPDRGVTITEDDLAVIAANTPPEIPVRIEHLGESPFDGALGVIIRLRAVGNKLWGTLRQPVEAWRLVQRAGARALSVALDVAGKRLLETSFVCRPRVASAQVFGGGQACFETEELFGGLGSGVGGRGADLPDPEPGTPDPNDKEEDMASVRQLAEGLIQHLRGVAAADEPNETARFAAERAALESERESLRILRVDQQMADLKRHGLVRATESAEGLARALLTFGEGQVVAFREEQVPLAQLFTRFLEENGAVVPMGELLRGDALSGAAASDRLISLARETARRDSLGYVAAFAQVSRANPELARAAREEAYNG